MKPWMWLVLFAVTFTSVVLYRIYRPSDSTPNIEKSINSANSDLPTPGEASDKAGGELLVPPPMVDAPKGSQPENPQPLPTPNGGVPIPFESGVYPESGGGMLPPGFQPEDDPLKSGFPPPDDYVPPNPPKYSDEDLEEEEERDGPG